MFYAQNIYNPIGESFPLLKKKKRKRWLHLLVPVILCDPMDCSLPGSSVHEIL